MNNPVLEYVDKKAEALDKRAKKVSEFVERKDRVRSLGFSNAKITRYKLDPVVAGMINELKFKHPFYKFLTPDELVDVCKTWGLCWGKAELYKGELPEKNLQDIEKFSMGLIFQSYRNGEYSEYDHQDHNDLTWDYFSEKQKTRLLQGYSVAKGPIFNRRRFRIPKFQFEILAPRKDFVKGTFKKGVKIEPIVKDDPIVVTQVRPGVYAIVTAWGPEAEDLRIFNEIVN